MTLLEDLYENYRGLVFNVVRQFTNNYDKAEDFDAGSVLQGLPYQEDTGFQG